MRVYQYGISAVLAGDDDARLAEIQNEIRQIKQRYPVDPELMAELAKLRKARKAAIKNGTKPPSTSSLINKIRQIKQLSPEDQAAVEALRAERKALMDASEGAVVAQMLAGHRYQNKLVEIECARRDARNLLAATRLATRLRRKGTTDMQPVNPALALCVSILRSLTEPETDFEHDRARAALFGLAEEALRRPPTSEERKAAGL